MKKIFSKKLLFILFFLFLIFNFNLSFAATNEIKFTDCFKKERTIVLNKDLCNFKYYSLFVFTQKTVPYNLIGFTGSDYEMALNVDGGYLYFLDGQAHDYYYKISSPLTSPTDIENFINKLNNYNVSNLTLSNRNILSATLFSSSGTQCLFANYNLKNNKGDIVFQSPSKFEINLSTTEKTNNSVIAYTNYFDYADAKKYKCYISTDAKNWNLMNYETFNNTTVGSTQFRFNYKILKNDTYYFKLLDTETNEEKYITVVVANILKNSTNSGFNEYGIPQPFLTYKRVNDEFIIKTQNFTLEDIQKYQGLYVKDSDFVTDYSQWKQMSLGSYNNTQLNQTEYYFYIKVPKNSENCIYYFVFYDYNQQKYGSPSSLNCDFTAMNEYVDKVSGVTEKKKTKFEELIDYFKQRFGFLTYPFEFIADLLNRILNINYSDPIIHIPSFNNPINNQKIFDGFDYNFNDLLNNAAIKNIYNIYLIAVDFIIIIGLIIFAYNTILGVFGNG